jgi:glycosyltransferase involved in cell wall biosynthesis
MPEQVRLALYSPWPVYYHAPLYRRVAADPRIAFTAIFGSDIGVHRRVSNGYAREIDFGVPVLDGYDAVFLRKASRNTSEANASLRDWDIITALRRGRFDALWMNGYRSITHQVAAATQISLGKALLVREEQTLLPRRRLWKRAAKSVGLRLLLRRAYGLYIGSENRRWFRHWGVPDDRLFFTPYTVDNDRLRKAARQLDPQREQLRRSFGLDPSKPVILSVCRLTGGKQPLMLLEAFRNLRASREASLLIVGSGPLESELQRTTAAERIPDVRFAGFLDQNEVTRAYAAADVFVLASTDETWGLVVNEAMNFGLPIVVTDRVGCGTDLVVDGENGFVIPPHDWRPLTNRLLDLTTCEQRRRAFGSASLRKIKAWNYETAAEGVVAAALASMRDRGAGLDRVRGAG